MVLKNDKKIIIIMYLVLIIILGLFLFMKCSNNIIYKDDYKSIEINKNKNKDDKIITNRFISKINNSEKYSNNKVVPVAPVLNFETNYTINLGNEFILPQVENENEYIPSLVEMKYYFKDYDNNEYIEVNSFDYNKLGSYKINYKVTNHYNLTTEKDIFIDVVDNVKPIIEGYIVTDNNGLKTFDPVQNNSIINKNITISFMDNDKVSYIEYYKEKIVFKENYEEEKLMDINTIENGNDLELNTDGKYIIRAYDRSGNYNEYTVTIDKTKAKLDIKYELTSNGVLVTVSSNEKVKTNSKYNKVNDYAFTKLYNENTNEIIKFYDEANNESIINVNVLDFHKINLLQNNISTSSTQLNILDGDIKLNILGNSNYSLEVKLDGEIINLDLSQNIINCGHYDIKLSSLIDELTYSFDIIDMNNLN